MDTTMCSIPVWLFRPNRSVPQVHWTHSIVDRLLFAEVFGVDEDFEIHKEAYPNREEVTVYATTQSVPNEGPGDTGQPRRANRQEDAERRKKRKRRAQNAHEPQFDEEADLFLQVPRSQQLAKKRLKRKGDVNLLKRPHDTSQLQEELFAAGESLEDVLDEDEPMVEEEVHPVLHEDQDMYAEDNMKII